MYAIFTNHDIQQCRVLLYKVWYVGVYNKWVYNQEKR